MKREELDVDEQNYRTQMIEEMNRLICKPCDDSAEERISTNLWNHAIYKCICIVERGRNK